MGTRRVVVEFLGDDKSLGKTATDAEKKTSKLGSTLSGVGKTAALGLAAGAGLGAVALVNMAKGAAEDEKAQAILAKTLKNTAGATDAQVASVEDYISKVGVATGVTDDEMRPALANLVRATKDTGKAQELMNLAMDASAGTGKSLESITLAMAKAQNGSTGALGKLGIATKDVNGKALTSQQVFANMAKTFSGQAAAGAQTLDGKMARLKLIFAETQETIGAKLLPVATRLADWFLKKGIPAISSFAGWVDRNKDVLIPLAKGLGAVTAAVWLLNIAMTANPIGLVVVAIGALAAGLVIAYKRSETFRNIVNTAFSVVKDAISGVITVGSAVIQFFKDLPGTVSRILGNTRTWLVGKGKAMLEGLKDGVWSIAKGIDSWMLRAPVARLLAPWYGAGRWLVQNGKNLIAGLKNGVTEIARTIGTWVYNNVIRPLVIPFLVAGQWLVSAGRRVVTGLVSGVAGYLRDIGGIGKWLYNNVIVPSVKPFVSAGTWLSRAGRDVIGGLLGGIALRMKGIASWVKGAIVDPMVTAVKHFFGIESPSKVFEGIGGHLIGGLMKGMGSGMGGAVAKKVFGDMPSALSALVGKGLVSLQGLPRKALDALANVQGAVIPGDIGLGKGANRKVVYSGEVLDWSTYQKIRRAEQMVGALNITQGSYEKASSYSGTTHTGGGVFDVVGGDLQKINAVLRSLGFASWVRSPSQGPWPWHIHAVELRNALLSASARGQAADYLRGGDGLGGYKQGTPWVPDDQLAFLHKGEAVIPADVNRRRMAGDGTVASFTINLVLDGKVIQQSLVRLKKLNGGLELGLA